MALREILAHFGFTFDKAALEKAGHAIEGVKHHTEEAGLSLKEFAEGLKGVFAGFVAGEIANITNEIAEQASALEALSQQTGLSTDDLQTWQLGAETAGAAADDFNTGLRRLSRELSTGVDETGQQSKLFTQLHIAAKNAQGGTRSLADVLPELADKFASMKSASSKAALAQELFGRSGVKLVPLLSRGAAGVADLRKQFQDLGGGFSEEAIKRADEYDSATKRLNFSFTGLKNQLLLNLLPGLTDVVDSVTKGAVAFSAWIKHTTALSSAVKVLAVVLGATLLEALAPFLLPGLVFAGIFLAVDDLIAFLEGKKSVIGELLDSWFGDGTATVVRKWCGDAADTIKSVLIGTLDLLKLALGGTDEEQEKLWQHFYAATQPVSDALDAIVDKIKLIKDIFDPDTLKEGANNFLDAITSPFDTEEDKQTKAKRREARAESVASEAVKNSGLKPAPDLKPAHAALANAFDNIANNVGVPPALQRIPSGAPVTNNISPVNVTQTFPPGTGPEVRKLAKDAAQQGVREGLAEYRAALQSLEQRAP